MIVVYFQFGIIRFNYLERSTHSTVYYCSHLKKNVFFFFFLSKTTFFVFLVENGVTHQTFKVFVMDHWSILYFNWSVKPESYYKEIHNSGLNILKTTSNVGYQVLTVTKIRSVKKKALLVHSPSETLWLSDFPHPSIELVDKTSKTHITVTEIRCGYVVLLPID